MPSLIAMVTLEDNVKLGAFHRMRAVTSLLSEAVSHDLEGKAGVNLDSIEVLKVLALSPDERLRLSDLAVPIGLTRSGLTRRLDRLEKEGLVRRQECETDKRGAYAVLTDRGRQVLSSAFPAFDDRVSGLFGDCMTEGEARQLSALLNRVSSRLEKR